MAQLPDQETLQALLHYEPDTGKLFWKERSLEMFKRERSWKMWNARYAGEETFRAVQPNGYLSGGLFGRQRYAHRVIWKLVYGEDPEQVDHVNGDRANNRLENLRNVSNLENGRNQKFNSRNTSGVMGVTWHKTASKWQAQIAVKGAYTHLGLYDDFEVAVAARKAAEIKHGFHPNHGRVA